MNKDVYMPAKEIQNTFRVSSQTLRNWANNGRLQCVKCQVGGKRLYNANQLEKPLGVQPAQSSIQPKQGILYARVSSAAQKQAGDLQRQIESLQAACPTYRLIQDVGSGLNFKRKGFVTLLDLVCKNMVSEVVVLHKDRLCRFGIDLVEHLFQKFGVKLVVLSNHASPTRTSTTELADDLIAITTVFVAKHNGQRAAENRKRRKASEKETQDPRKTRRTAIENHSGTDFSNHGTAQNHVAVDGNGAVDL